MKRSRYVTGAAAVAGGVASALVIALTAGASPSSKPASTKASSSGARAVAANYRVFRTSSKASILPLAAQTQAQQLVVTDPKLPASIRTGAMIPGSGRVLLVHPGSSGLSAYGFATTAGRACILIPHVMAGCDRGDVQTEPLVWMSGGPDGGPGVITGLARDGVSSVDVMVGAQARQAVFANNAFYFELPLSQLRQVTALRVTMKDTSVVNIKLPTLVEA